MTNGSGQGTTFKAFFDVVTFWDSRDVGMLDGRGTAAGEAQYFDDVRDSAYGWSVRFQRYEFIHSARYITFGYRVADAANVGWHTVRLYEGTNLLLVQTVPGGRTNTPYLPMTVDLGVPTFERRTIDLRIGWTLSNTDRNKQIRFRINRVFLTDFI